MLAAWIQKQIVFNSKTVISMQVIRSSSKTHGVAPLYSNTRITWVSFLGESLLKLLCFLELQRMNSSSISNCPRSKLVIFSVQYEL